MMRLIQEWKQDLLVNWKEGIKRVANEAETIISEHGRHAFILNKNGCASKWIDNPRQYRDFWQRINSPLLDGELQKLIDNHFNIL